MLPISVSKAQEHLANHVRARRLSLGLTQKGLSLRSGVSLPTLRKFEQKGLISLESFLKLLVVVGGLDRVVAALEPDVTAYASIDEVLADTPKAMPKKGWRT